MGNDGHVPDVSPAVHQRPNLLNSEAGNMMVSGGSDEGQGHSLDHFDGGILKKA